MLSTELDNTGITWVKHSRITAVNKFLSSSVLYSYMTENKSVNNLKSNELKKKDYLNCKDGILIKLFFNHNKSNRIYNQSTYKIYK